jgi:predicted nucleic acid-binding protein
MQRERKPAAQRLHLIRNASERGGSEMRVPRIYLETSVFNFVFADDAPEKREDTLKLFGDIKAGEFEPYTSEFVTDELRAAKQPKREDMLNLIPEYGIDMIKKSDAAMQLAKMYVAEGAVPEKFITDAVHIAVASIGGLDAIVSWNFKHIVKLKTIRLTEIVNLKHGYRRIGIHSPTEVIDDG